MATPIVTFDADAWPERSRVGGKADGLKRLVDAGFSVPPGFCVTTEAFYDAVRRCEGEAETLAELRRLVAEVELPDALIDAVASELDRIGAERWAVRSSAVDEDRVDASFAGQQHTELDVDGVDGVVSAMRRVWAGCLEVESLLYRSRVRVDVVPGAMAVVVQAMVDGEVGGVAFTRDPMADVEAESEGHMVAAAAERGPQSVVEGEAGEYYRFDRRDGTPVAGPSGGPLTEASVEHLGRALARLAADEEGPRDVEWIVGSIDSDGGAASLYMLQSRLATGDGESEPTVWTNANVGEALPGVATPLTWSIIGAFSRRGFEQAFGTLGLEVPEDAELVGSFRGRVYLNLTEFVSIASGVPIFKPDVLFEMAGGGGLELVRDTAQNRSTLGFLKRLPMTLLRVGVSQSIMPLVAPLWSRYFEGRLEEFFARDRRDASRAELTDELDRVDWLFDRTGLVMLTCSSNFLMSYVVMKTFLRWFGAEEAEERERELFEALEVRSAEPAIDLLEIAEQARRIPAVERLLEETSPESVRAELEARAGSDEAVANFLEAVDAFRREHGHRAPREAELSTPRWREDDVFLFETLAQYLEVDEMSTPEDYRERWMEERRSVDAAVDEIFAPLAGSVFRAILAWARGTARIREFMRLHVVQSLDLYRELARDCGDRLVDEGRLDTVDDVFYLRRRELRNWLERGPPDTEAAYSLRVRALIRRTVVDRLREMPDPPGTFVHERGDLVAADSYRDDREPVEIRSGDRVLEGLSGARGRRTGVARVVRDPEEDESVRPGEILVAPQTDVGWTPMFLTASALVVGLGGPLSHACIVAREFGIPTVVNVQSATDVIATGDKITVDGNEGIVVVHSGDERPNGA